MRETEAERAHQSVPAFDDFVQGSPKNSLLEKPLGRNMGSLTVPPTLALIPTDLKTLLDACNSSHSPLDARLLGDAASHGWGRGPGFSLLWHAGKLICIGGVTSTLDFCRLHLKEPGIFVRLNNNTYIILCDRWSWKMDK